MCQRLFVNANGDICSTICWLIISSWGWNKPSCQRICSVMVYKLYLSMKYWQFLNNVILIKQTYISDIGHFSWCWQLCWGVLGFILLTTFELFGFSILCLMKVIQKLIVRTKLHIYVFCEPRIISARFESRCLTLHTSKALLFLRAVIVVLVLSWLFFRFVCWLGKFVYVTPQQ
jgi:hypothetical protein